MRTRSQLSSSAGRANGPPENRVCTRRQARLQQAAQNPETAPAVNERVLSEHPDARSSGRLLRSCRRHLLGEVGSGQATQRPRRKRPARATACFGSSSEQLYSNSSECEEASSAALANPSAKRRPAVASYSSSSASSSFPVRGSASSHHGYENETSDEERIYSKPPSQPPKSSCGRKREPRAKKRDAVSEADVNNHLERWSEVNRKYREKLDEYLHHEFQSAVRFKLLFLEYDLHKLTPDQLLRAIYKELFISQRKVSLCEISETLSALAHDALCTVRIVISIKNWVALLCEPTLFSYIEDMVQASSSPFMFILKSDLVRSTYTNSLKIKWILGASDSETLLLLPTNHGKKISQYVDEVWYGPLLQNVVFRDRATTDATADQADTSPCILKSGPKYNDLPRFASGYVFSQELHQVRGLPKSSQTRTLVAPMKALQEIRALAYDEVLRS